MFLRVFPAGDIPPSLFELGACQVAGAPCTPGIRLKKRIEKKGPVKTTTKAKKTHIKKQTCSIKYSTCITTCMMYDLRKYILDNENDIYVNLNWLVLPKQIVKGSSTGNLTLLVGSTPGEIHSHTMGIDGTRVLQNRYDLCHAYMNIYTRVKVDGTVTMYGFIQALY